jgi:5'-nucleotidase
LTYSEEISFLVAAEFAARIARLLLEKKFPPDVDLLKVDVPSDATVDTPWQLTRVSRQRYYEPLAPVRVSWQERAIIGYREAGEFDREPENTDVYVLRKKRMVSVSPLSLDLTSRVDFAGLDRFMRS